MEENKKLVDMLLMCDLIYPDYYRDYIGEFEEFMGFDIDLTKMVKLFLNDNEYKDDLSIIIRYLGRMALNLNKLDFKTDEKQAIVKELEHTLKICKRYINPIKVVDKIRGFSSELACEAYKEKSIHDNMDVIHVYSSYDLKIGNKEYEILGIKLQNCIEMKYRLLHKNEIVAKDIKTVIIKDDILSYYSSETKAKDKEFDIKFICIQPTIRKIAI